MPDAATGQCVAMSVPSPATPAPNEVPAAPEPKQEVPEGATPPAAKPDENAKPILFRLREKAAPPFSPSKW